MNGNIKDHLYLWCHDPGVYNSIEGLKGSSTATPAEAARFMGIDTLIMVSYAGKPQPPFAPLHKNFASFKRVVWSLIGDTACRYDSKEAFVDEVISLKEKFPNVTGGIMDDFFNEERTFDLDAISKKMHRASLPLWVVLYAHQLDREDLFLKLEMCDVITFWTWDIKDIGSMEQNLSLLRQKFPDKKIVSGCYLWNFGGSTPLTLRHMEYQCNAALDALHNGTIDDIILLGSPLVGMELPSVEWARQWVRSL